MKRRLPLLLLGLFLIVATVMPAKPRVFVFTDINIDAGDPDDRQSLVHLFWYADELEIVGVVPDRWSAQGGEACQRVLAAYSQDYDTFHLGQKGYPPPARLAQTIARDQADAMQRFAAAVAQATPDAPLWVLVWGNMSNAGPALRQNVEHLKNVRLVTIGTGLMYEPDMQHLPPDWERSAPCVQLNWNGEGRNAIYRDPRFHELWWLEINWTYNGMFSGEEPKALFQTLAGFGALGQHIQEVTKNEPWARYFRVGDTPSVLYVIDPRGRQDDPTRGSWAGQFKRPFPRERPHYYTDDHGSVEWNYADPCATWANHPQVHAYSKGTLEKERPAMYAALVAKLERVYGCGQP